MEKETRNRIEVGLAAIRGRLSALSKWWYRSPEDIMGELEGIENSARRLREDIWRIENQTQLAGVADAARQDGN